jgi:hypothetical protein
MSDWNKDMSESMAKLFVYKKQLAYGYAFNIICLICRDMEQKHGLEFVKRLLVITGLQDEVEITERQEE